MRITNPITKGIENLLTSPGKELGRWVRFLRFQIQLWRFCARRLAEQNAMAMSAALSFRTMFALIPLLVLAVLILGAVGILDQGKKSLHQFLEATGLTEITLNTETAPTDDR